MQIIPTQSSPMQSFPMSGGAMPALGLGTWKSDPGEVGAAVEEAVRVGYRHIDCAAIYGNEAEIGEALERCFSAGHVRREQMWITSKLWNDRHAPEEVIPALKESLHKLRLDHLDLYLIHWPIALKRGVSFPQQASDLLSLEQVPLADTWRAMEEAREAGLCRNIGVSNLSVKKLRALIEETGITPAANQVEMHPYLPQRELLAFCQARGVVVTAYSPLGSRDRPMRAREEDDPVLLEDATLAALASAKGCTPAQLLLAWALHRGTSVIPKSTHPERLRQNLEAAALALTEDEVAKIDALDRGRRYIAGRFWALPGGPYTVQSLWDE